MPENRRSSLEMAPEQPGSLPPQTYDPYAAMGPAGAPEPSPLWPQAFGAVGGDISDIARSVYAAGPGTLEQFATGQLEPGTPEAAEAARTTAMTYGLPGGAPGEALSAGVRIPREAPKLKFPGQKPKLARDPRIDPLTVEQRQMWARSKAQPIDPVDLWRWNPKTQKSERAFAEPPLFSYSDVDEAARTGQVPAATAARVPQTPFPVAPDAPKGIPQYISGPMTDPQNLQRVRGSLRRGRDLGSYGWYATENLRNLWLKLGGTPESFNRLIGHFMGAASPGSAVPMNLRYASLYNYLKERGLADPIDLEERRYGLLPRLAQGGTAPRLEQELPEKFGSKTAGQHMQNVQAVLRAEDAARQGLPLAPELQHGGISTITNPKPPRFGGALLGNWENYPFDIHMGRDWGLLTNKGRAEFAKGTPLYDIPTDPQFGYWVESPDIGHYGYLQRTASQLAPETRGPGSVPPAPAAGQAAIWTGGAEETKVRSGVAPFAAILESRLRYTADILGKSPLEVLEDVALGRGVLLQAGDISGMIAGGTAQTDRGNDERGP